MSARELILDGGELLDGNRRMLRVNDTPDRTCVVISAVNQRGPLAVLDRTQQHMLFLYLQERLGV